MSTYNPKDVIVLPLPKPHPPLPPFYGLSSHQSDRTEKPERRPLGEAEALESLLLRLKDLLRDAAERPDYQGVMDAYGPVVQRKLEGDPEVMEALRRILKRYDVELGPDNTVSNGGREPVSAAVALGTIVVFAIGVIAGWESE